jgi:hypothetical protein
MAIVLLEWMKSLAARIEAAVPELVGKVKTEQQPAGVEQVYPTLTITHGTLKFEPFGEFEHATIGDPSLGNVVFNVGERSGPVQLRIVATTPGERMLLEQKVTNLFLSQERRAGILVCEVTACPELGNWLAAFEYDSDQWINVDAFDRKLESLIIVNGILPALVARTAVYEIGDLVLGLTADFTTEFTSTMVPGVEVVKINDDGTIEPWMPPP